MDTEQESHGSQLAADFLSARDRLTGVRGASILSTSSGVRQIDREIPGAKEIHLFDFNGMSDANLFGMRQNVDNFLRDMPEKINAVLDRHALRGELLRLGGDEFVLVLEHRARTSGACVSDIRRELRVLRGKFFRGQKRLKDARWFKSIKTAFRDLRAEFCRTLDPGEQFSFERYREFIEAHLGQIEERAKAVSRPIMSVSSSARLIESGFTVRRVNQALGQCSWSVHEQKRLPGESRIRRRHSRVIPLDQFLPADRAGESFVRKAEAAEIYGAAQRQAKYRQMIRTKEWFEGHEDPSYREYVPSSVAAADFFRLRDNVLGQTVRLDFARSLLLTDYAGPGLKKNAEGCRREDLRKRRIIGVLTVDLNYFSIFNNQWDYNRANVLLLPVEQELLKLNPWLIVRSGGGTLTAFVSSIPMHSREDLLRRISSKITEALSKAVKESPDGDRLMAEYYERLKIAEAGNIKFGLGLELSGFPSLQVSYRDEPVYIDREMTQSREVGEFFRR